MADTPRWTTATDVREAGMAWVVEDGVEEEVDGEEEVGVGVEKEEVGVGVAEEDGEDTAVTEDTQPPLETG